MSKSKQNPAMALAMDGKLEYVEAKNRKGVAYQLPVRFISHTGAYAEAEGASDETKETYRRIMEIANAETQRSAAKGTVARVVGSYSARKQSVAVSTRIKDLNASKCPTVVQLAAARKQQLAVLEAGAEARAEAKAALLVGAGI